MTTKYERRWPKDRGSRLDFIRKKRSVIIFDGRKYVVVDLVQTRGVGQGALEEILPLSAKLFALSRKIRKVTRGGEGGQFCYNFLP